MSSATFTITFGAGHRKTSRPEECVAYIVNQPDGDEPAVSYTLDAARPGDHAGQAVPSLVNTFTGATESPPSSIALAEASSSDPIAEETVTATQGLTTQTIYHSKRGCMVTRWATNLSEYFIEQEWMRRAWHEGLGDSFNPNIRWQENLFLASQNMHNPTTGGTILQPWPENDDPNDLVVSRPLYHANANGGAGTAFTASACNPLQWDSEGETEPPYTNHGGAQHRAILWWRYKFFQRVDPHFGGREYIHRFTSWAHFPRALDEADFGGDVSQGGAVARLICSHGFPLSLWNIFDQANWLDIATGTLSAIDGWDELTDPSAGNWEAYDSVTRYLNDVARADEASRISSGYGAAILTRTSDKFTVAIAAKVSGGPATIGRMGRYTRPTYIHVSRSFHGIVPTTPDFGGKDSASIGIETASFVGANAGWHGLVAYVFVGVEDDVEAALTELYTSGLLDAVPDESLIPASVADGTEFDVTSPYSASAAFTLTFGGSATADVVDESGSSVAASYTTASSADLFLELSQPAAWLAATPAEKNRALAIATQWLDLKFGMAYPGYRETQTQALLWPRVMAYDNEGYALEGIPDGLQRATAMVAARWLADPTVLAPDIPADDRNLQSQSHSMGQHSWSRSYSGARSHEAHFTEVLRLLRMRGIIDQGWVRR